MIATGATPRRLPNQPNLAGLFTLRTLDDALALRELLDARPKVVVIGAGFIGAEIAATCRGRGLDVTVLEALPQPMVRGLGPELGAVLAAIHRDHGVDLRTGVLVDVDRSTTVRVRLRGVRLGDGTVIDAGVVVVGVGVVPETGWLEGSGLTLDNGVVCDETCLAAPGIVAAGDVARWPNPLFDGALDAARALDQRDRTGRARGAAAPRTRRAVRAGSVRVVRPVRPQDPDRRHRVGRRADVDVHVAHGTLGESSSSRCSAGAAA